MEGYEIRENNQLGNEFALKKDIERINEELVEIKHVLKLIQSELHVRPVESVRKIDEAIENGNIGSNYMSVNDILAMASSITNSLVSTNSIKGNDKGVSTVLDILGLSSMISTKSQQDELEKLYNLLTTLSDKERCGEKNDITNVLGMLFDMMTVKKDN